uniref:Uncharacterized protein n=1 Tax=viral metagenome TaxID=1070528 RepID=A0A6C0CIQ6_9ZZZZ
MNFFCTRISMKTPSRARSSRSSISLSKLILSLREKSSEDELRRQLACPTFESQFYHGSSSRFGFIMSLSICAEYLPTTSSISCRFPPLRIK